MINNLFQIRITGVYLENNKILLVKQKLKDRDWSLPGGRLEVGETIEQGIAREMYEETGLTTKVNKLLYICDKTNTNPPLIHITFLLDKIAGELTNPTNEFDNNPITEVKLVPIMHLTEYGFTEKFQNIVMNGFEECGSYMGLKKNIGL